MSQYHLVRTGPRRALATSLTVVLAGLLGTVAIAQGPADAAGPLISQGKTATASSIEGDGLAAAFAVDAAPGT